MSSRLRVLRAASGCALVLALAGSAPAAAALAPLSAVNPVRIPVLNNASVGDARLDVAFTDTTATATASAAAVSLQRNGRYRVRTCLRWHVRASFPAATCTDKLVDTSGNAAPKPYAAPTVTKAMARPAAGGSATVSSEVDVAVRQANGSYDETATSWPVGGVAKAALGIPALGAWTARAPVSEGAALASGATGGVNTFTPDATCLNVDVPASTATPAGVSTKALGALPYAYEVGEPTG